MKSKIFFGLLLMVIGVLLLLQNLGFLDGISVWQYVLPVALIGIGASNASSKRRANTADLLFILVGLVMLASRLGFIAGISVWRFVPPAILIILGLKFLTQKKIHPDSVEIKCGKVDVNAFFSGAEARCDSDSFEHGEINVAFGGASLDLSQAQSQFPACHLEANAFFGGIEIIVPKSWAVSTAINGILGGYENKAYNPANPVTVLTVSGNAFCGGIEIKSR